MAIEVGRFRCSLELQLSANTTVRFFATAHRTQLIVFAQAEALRSSLHQLERLLELYSPFMGGSTGRVVERAIQYGAVFAEVSSLI